MFIACEVAGVAERLKDVDDEAETLREFEARVPVISGFDAKLEKNAFKRLRGKTYSQVHSMAEKLRREYPMIRRIAKIR
jgi:hypothetical protein